MRKGNRYILWEWFHLEPSIEKTQNFIKTVLHDGQFAACFDCFQRNTRQILIYHQLTVY